MRERILAVGIIVKRNLLEVLLNPGIYITTACSLLLAFLLANGFTASIGSSGFSPAQNPLYLALTGILSGMFGETMTTGIFCTGPFLFILFPAFLPCLIYLSIGLLYKLGYERNTGALELIAYGPADGTACLLAAVLCNIVLTAGYMVVLFVYCLFLGLFYNLALGSMFYASLVLLFFCATALYCYSALIAILTENTASGIGLFLAVFALFLLLLTGSFSMATGYLQTLSLTFSLILQWLSPFYYWNHGLTAIDYGQAPLFLLDILLLLLLPVALLFLCHLLIRRKGVHA